MPPHAPLLSLHIGRIAPLGPDGRLSAIHKPAVPGPLQLTRMGLAGDEQADLQNHGGPDKALHHYPREHYEAWRAELEAQNARFVPGGFGENLSTWSLTEDNVCVGDVFRLGGARVQVSQGRTPCGKLNLRFAVPDMARRVRESGRTGWYYRVLEPGPVALGDAFFLEERPCGDWPLARVGLLLREASATRADLAALAELEPLARSWREKARQRLSGSHMEQLQRWLRRVLPG